MKTLQNTFQDGWKKRKSSSSLFLPNPESMISFAKDFANTLVPGDLIYLRGDLGAGKTLFVKGVAEAFGISHGEVSSPTFVYLHLYQNRIAHFDLYRMERGEEFFERGFEEFISNEWITFIEWPEKIEKFFHNAFYLLSFKHEGEGRRLSIEKSV